MSKWHLMYDQLFIPKNFRRHEKVLTFPRMKTNFHSSALNLDDKTIGITGKVLGTILTGREDKRFTSLSPSFTYKTEVILQGIVWHTSSPTTTSTEITVDMSYTRPDQRTDDFDAPREITTLPPVIYTTRITKVNTCSPSSPVRLKRVSDLCQTYLYSTHIIIDWTIYASIRD